MTTQINNAARAMEVVREHVNQVLTKTYRQLIQEVAPTAVSCTWDAEPEYDDAGGTFLSVYSVRVVFACGTSIPIPCFSDIDCGEWTYFDPNDRGFDVDPTDTDAVGDGNLPPLLLAYEQALISRGLVKDLEELCSHLAALYYQSFKPSDSEMKLTEEDSQQPRRTQAVDNALGVVINLLHSLPLQPAA